MQNEGAPQIIINAVSDGYYTDQCGETMTVGQLRDLLEAFDPESPIFLSFDEGYTYGRLDEIRIEKRFEDEEGEF